MSSASDIGEQNKPSCGQRVVLVTGASSGIGFACAKEFAARGYLVFASARRLELMEPLKEYGVVPIEMDVSSSESINDAKKFIYQYTGNERLDILYNNAGQSCTTPALDVTDDAMRQCYEVNVFGSVRTTRAFAPFLINAKGVVGFTGSVTGIISFPWLSIYASSKAALASYAATLRLELKPFDVTVITIVTGGVDTDIEDTRPLPQLSIYNVPEMIVPFKFRQQMVKRNRPMSAADYARQVVSDFEAAKYCGKLEYFRGSKALLLYYIARYFPRCWIEWGIIRKFQLAQVFGVLKKKYIKKDMI